MLCLSSLRSTSASMTSSHPLALTVPSSLTSVTSAFFELHKPYTSSSPVSDARQRLPAPLLEHCISPWRQHPGSSFSPAAFLEYLRLVNLHSCDAIGHRLAADSSDAAVWSAAEPVGTTSRTFAEDATPASVVRPSVVRPTALQPFASAAATQRPFLDRLETSTSPVRSSSIVQLDSSPLWRPAVRPAAGGSRRELAVLPPPPPRRESNVLRGDCSPSVPPPPPSVPFPCAALPLLPQLPSGTRCPPSSSSSSEFALWLPRNCAGLLSAVMHRQVAAAAAAAAASADRRGIFPVSTGPPHPLPSQRHFDVMATSRLPGGPPQARLPTPPSASKRLFSCPQCRYLTDRKNNLKRHVSTMHHESDKQLECCTIVFKSKASLRDHVLIFHGAGYQCRHCGRNFCRKALLKRHLTVHSGQKDYVCARCDYATSHKSNLERHKKVRYGRFIGNHLRAAVLN